MKDREPSPIWFIAAGVLTTLAIAAFLAYPQLSDFSIFYGEGAAWNHGAPLYTSTDAPNLNPPTATLLLFAPLAWLPLRGGQLAWLLLEIAGLVASLRLVARELRPPRFPLAVALLLITHGAAIAFVQGQLTWILLYPVTRAWLHHRRGQFVAASAWLAPAIAIKPPLALLALLLSWPVWLTAGALSAGLSGAGLLVTGAEPWRAWLALSGAVRWLHLSFNASLWGLAARWSGTRAMSELAPLAVAAVLAAGAALAWRAGREGDADRRFGLAVLWSVLLSPLGWGTYLPLAFAPLVAVRPSGWVFGVAYALACLPLGGGQDVGRLAGSLYGAAALLAFAATASQVSRDTARSSIGWLPLRFRSRPAPTPAAR